MKNYILIIHFKIKNQMIVKPQPRLIHPLRPSNSHTSKQPVKPSYLLILLTLLLLTPALCQEGKSPSPPTPLL